MKIVIIDDDSIVLMSLKTIIEAGGIEVLATGKSGAEAVELYESRTSCFPISVWKGWMVSPLRHRFWKSIRKQKFCF